MVVLNPVALPLRGPLVLFGPTEYESILIPR